MDTEDGHLFIKHLAYYIRTHEKALANSLQLQRQVAKPSTSKSSHGPNIRPAISTASSTMSLQTTSSTTSTAGNFSTSWSLPYLGLSSRHTKPAKLYLTPNQLYYLLCRFDELGVSVGPMNVRLENIHSDYAHSNYVSFLTKVQKPAGRTSDQDSIHSVSSVRSVMSSVSSMWSNLSLSNNSSAKLEKRKAAELEDLRYLYSAFTKIPYLKLALDHRVRRIAGYEEFPFDTAVPVFAFKNVSSLEVVDVDFRSFFGWDRLADQLRSLTVKRAALDDPTDLLTHIVLDDIDKRRRRSCKTPTSPMQPASAQTPTTRAPELSRYFSASDSPVGEDRRHMSESPGGVGSTTAALAPSRPQPRTRSRSPGRPPGSSRNRSTQGPYRRPHRRSSESSTSSAPLHTPRNSSSNLLALNSLPPSKWRFLRHLSLADNGLTAISAQSLAPVMQTLQSLDLSSNLFTEIPDSLASLVSLRALNLSNCMVESLHSLSRHPLPAISVLNLRANRIVSLAGVERLVSLERLDLRENKLRDPMEMARLTGMPEFHDLFVVRNPFTRAYPNHRVTIFNLFRQTPGYADDITIDTSGPGYSERRHLVDRVPESINVPVMSMPVEEDEPATRVTPAASVSTATTTPQPGAPARMSEERGAIPSTPETPREDDLSKPFRKRKSIRRRVVDISETGSPGSRGSIDSPELKFVSAVQTPVVAQQSEATPSRLHVRSGEKREQEGDKATTTPRNAPTDSPAGRKSLVLEDSSVNGIGEAAATPDLGQSSETYRKKIEALKKEHGSNWLNALGDEERGPSFPFPKFREKDIGVSGARNGAVPTPTAISPTVGSGRRLG